MPETIKLKKGLDIKLEGEAGGEDPRPVPCALHALKPTDFRALVPKLEVKAGDRVRAGDPLFSNKHNPAVKFTAPVSGTVEEIRRGEKRKILAVVVKADERITYKEFATPAPGEEAPGERIIELLLESGLWPLIKQRPYDIIADPATRPKAIFVTAFDSSPLAPDYKILLKNERPALRAGLNALSKLTGGTLHLNARAGETPLPADDLPRNVKINHFAGPHPAGNVGVQIHHLDPINKGETAWVVNLPDVALIGRFLSSGRVDLRQLVALAGSEVTAPAYLSTITGARVGDIVKGRLRDRERQRVISGNVLTGERVTEDSFLGFYHRLITVIPEGDRPEFLGWATPGLEKFSMSRAFPSFLFPNKRYRLNANYHGEQRAFVMSGQYEKVLPMDILPVYLLKAILAGDIEKMEQLGILEVAPEDLALCEFACTSKIPVQEIIASGIERMMKELT
ncbi:MAG: Na(+)-translocating NADH-quinone reductase subunit A [Odoribacteraceae bacterium]|jgi:Na+-transporting NADH:ubiquinone oxidoreductase subunit A|nr:Na(+)-translocating NADH-quinone reductase subunit A [Odoribacteraceae bacterium]